MGGGGEGENGQRRIALRPLIAREGGTINLYGQQFQPFAIEHQRPVMRATKHHGKTGGDDCAVCVEREIEVNVWHQPVRRAIVLAVDDYGRGGGSGIGGGGLNV